MPDFGFIANAQPPNALSTLGDIMRVGQGAQQLKMQSLELQKAQQLNQDRLALQDFTANPDNWQTNGKIDMGKINSAVPKIAPLAGPDFINRMTTLGNAETQATQAKQNLTQSQRTIIAGPIGVLGRAGVQDPQAYIKAIDDIVKQNPDNPDIQKLGDAYKTTLGLTQAGPHVAQVAVTASQALMGPTEQQSSLSPQAGLTNTGGAFQETITQPAVGGNAPSVSMTGRAQPLTLGPGETQTLGKDLLGNPVVIPRSPSGEYGAPQPLPGSQKPLMGYPAGESEDTRKQFTNEYSQAGNQYLQSGTIHSFNKELLRAIDTATATGSPGQVIAKAESLFGNVAGASDAEKAASAYDLIGKYTERQALLAAQTMGPQTNAGLEAQIKANGSQAYNPTALKQITKLNDALQTGLDAYYPGLKKAIESSPNQIFAKRQFDQQWAQNFTPEVMQLYNAAKSGDKEEVNRIVNSVGGKGSKGAIDLARRAHNIQMLSQQGSL